MSTAPSRSRPIDRPDFSTDEWLIDAARRAGHRTPHPDRPGGISAWRLLLGAGLSDDEILRIACDASGAEAADFTRVTPALRSALAHEVALEHRVAPVGVRNGVLAVATVNPKNPSLERALAFAAKQRVSLQAASPGAILRAQSIIYGSETYGATFNFEVKVPATQAAQPSAVHPRPTPISRISIAMPVPAEARDATAAPAAADAQAAANDTKNSPESLVERVLTTAVTERAAEIHLEPAPQGGLVVRFRIDGKLNDRFRTSEVHASRLMQKLKSMAQLNAADTRVAQSGHSSFNSAEGRIDLRISTEPVGVAHEKMLVKLHGERALLRLTELGLLSPELDRIEQLLAAPRGLVLVAGPNASGRTTTLYAMARELKQRGRRVATLEDSIAFRMDGIRQIAVADSQHLTLTSAVRATIALDAGAVIIEVPSDRAALEAMATADVPRLILASIDAPDIAGAIAKLYEMEIDPAAIARNLIGVVSQRLIRRLCRNCAAPHQASDLPESQQSLLLGRPTANLRHPIGCEKCRGTGFVGRTAATEVVTMTTSLANAVMRRADAAELARVARESGPMTLWDTGMHSVLEGKTTLGELLDTMPPPEDVGASAGQQEDIDALLSQLLGSPIMQAASAPPLVAGAAGAPAVATPPKAAPAPAAVRPAPAAAGQRALRVLLVDDDATGRQTLAESLKASGFGVLEAADGAAALTYAERLRPDVILTDIAIAKLDAFGLIQALKEKGLPSAVVIHTAQEDEGLHAWLRESGAREILPRSLSVETLIRRLRVAAG